LCSPRHLDRCVFGTEWLSALLLILPLLLYMLLRCCVVPVFEKVEEAVEEIIEEREIRKSGVARPTLTTDTMLSDTLRQARRRLPRCVVVFPLRLPPDG